MLPAPSTAPAAIDVAERYIRPLAGREIRGLAWVGEDLLVLDARTGRLALVDPATDGTRVVNDGIAGAFLDAGGLALAAGARGPRRLTACIAPAGWRTPAARPRTLG